MIVSLLLASYFGRRQVKKAYQRGQDAVVIRTKPPSFSKSRPYSETDEERAYDREDDNGDVYHVGVGVALLVGSDRHCGGDDRSLSDLTQVDKVKKGCVCNPGASSKDRRDRRWSTREVGIARQGAGAKSAGASCRNIRKAKKLGIRGKSVARNGTRWEEKKKRDNGGFRRERGSRGGLICHIAQGVYACVCERLRLHGTRGRVDSEVVKSSKPVQLPVQWDVPQVARCVSPG